MKLLKFGAGWLWWHLKAAAWYLALAFRLFFAVGLDRDFQPGEDQDMVRHFRYPAPRSYRRFL